MELVDVRSESTKLGPLTRYNGTPFYSHVARWDLTGGSHADPEVHARPGNMDDMLRALNEGWVDARIDPKAEGVMIDIEMGGNTRFTFPGAEWEDPVTPIAAKQTIIKGDGSSRFSELLTKGDLIWRDYAREKLWYLYLYRAYAERWGGEDFAAQIGAAAPLRVGSWNMWTTPNMEHYQPSEAKHQFVWDLMELQTRLFTGGGEILDEIGVSPRFFAAYVSTTDVRIDFFEKWKAKFDLKMRMARATSHDAIPVVWPYMAAKAHKNPSDPQKTVSWQTVRDEERAKAIKAGISRRTSSGSRIGSHPFARRLDAESPFASARLGVCAVRVLERRQGSMDTGLTGNCRAGGLYREGPCHTPTQYPQARRCMVHGLVRCAFRWLVHL